MYSAILFGYLGPETILPAASILAAFGGFLLAMGRKATYPFAVAYRKVFGKPEPANETVVTEEEK